MNAPGTAPPERGSTPAEESGVFAHHSLPIGSVIGGLEIVGLIGEGGFGIVYLAYDPTLQRQVALKEYMPSALAARRNNSTDVSVKSAKFLDTFNAGLRSFINEARLLAHFDHPSLVKVHQFWQANRTAYMVMPYYQGETLKAHMRAMADKGQTPDEATLRRWLMPLLDALEVIHAEQCYHRDIAPDNILLTQNGPLLLDFGAARRVISDMTQALTVILKPGFAPIEQYGEASSMTQGPWTDLYALASVVYFCITGRAPITSVERVMGDPLPQLSSVAAGRYAPAFLKAIDAALAVKPGDRPQSVAAFRALLQQGLTVTQPSAVDVTVVAPVAPIARTARTAPAAPAARTAPVARTAPAAQSPAGDLPPTELLLRPADGTPSDPPVVQAPPSKRPMVALVSAAALLALAAGMWWSSGGDEPHEEVLPNPPRRAAPSAGSAAALPGATPPREGTRMPETQAPAARAVPDTAPGAPAQAAAPVAMPTPAVAPARPSAALATEPPPPAASRPAAAPALATPAARTPVSVPPADETRSTAPPAAREERQQRRDTAPAPPARQQRAPAAEAAAIAAPLVTPAPPAAVAEPAPAATPAPPAARAAPKPDEGARAPARPPRCAELFQKGSQQPLTLDEATFLRNECR